MFTWMASERAVSYTYTVSSQAFVMADEECMWIFPVTLQADIHPLTYSTMPACINTTVHAVDQNHITIHTEEGVLNSQEPKPRAGVSGSVAQ